MRYGYGLTVAALCFCSLAMLGCSGSGTADNAATASAAAQPATSSAAEESVKQAVHDFLEAVRTGDGPKAESMFTGLARKKMAEMAEPIQVAPRASDTAKYEIGQVDLLEADGARVTCKWTDLDKEGQYRTDDMIWMLRKEPEGWRVAGMAAVVFEGEDPLLLDFESPEETLNKLEMLRAEIKRRMEEPTEQAQQPEKNPDENLTR